MRFVDELDFGFGWIDDGGKIRRTSHAVVDGDGVWLIDPIDWDDALARARDLGEIRGVIQLLDRHERDAPSIASRLGVTVHRVPRSRVPGTSFEFPTIVRRRFWDEVALWSPERRTLVVADALGTLGYFVGPGETLGVHPLLRPWPPRSLRSVFPEHVLVGHGEGVHDEASHALHEALRTARRRFPRALAHMVRSG